VVEVAFTHPRGERRRRDARRRRWSFIFYLKRVWGRRTNPPVNNSIRQMRKIIPKTTCTIQANGGGTGIREMIQYATAKITKRRMRESRSEIMFKLLELAVVPCYFGLLAATPLDAVGRGGGGAIFGSGTVTEVVVVLLLLQKRKPQGLRVLSLRIAW